MPEDEYRCPSCGGSGGESTFDGDSAWGFNTCELCEGKKEVDEDTYDAYMSRPYVKAQRLQAIKRKQESDAWLRRTHYIKTHIFCAYDGKEKTGFNSFLSSWYRCKSCKEALCESHARLIAKRAPFFSLASYICPYCSGEMHLV